MHLHVAPTVSVAEAVIRFPLTAGVRLRAVTANGKPAAELSGDSVTLRNLTEPVDLDAQF